MVRKAPKEMISLILRKQALRLQNSFHVQHVINHAYNVKMPTIVGILTFISMINTRSESMEAREVFIFQHFSLKMKKVL